MKKSRGGGPKTKNGKAIVSRNAIKHGMTSIQPVIEGIEDEADWFRFRDDIVASLAPEGAIEQEIAAVIALTLWRKRRPAFYENAIINYQVANTEADIARADAYLDGTLSEGELPQVEPNTVAAFQHTRMIPSDRAAQQIMRFETHLHRLWLQNQHELEALQSRRRGEKTHLARLDVSSPPMA